MKLFKYTSGLDVKYGAADNEKDAYDRREEVDPNYHFMSVRIEEVTLPGHTITVEPEKKGKK